MIAVVGEALVDLVADDGVLRPALGGGPFNTAVALGRLDVPVAYVGRLSDDRFGDLLERKLAESGVDLRYVARGAAPTPLAVVHTSARGEAEYSFYLEGTAYAQLELPELDPEIAAVHVGTLALATDPPGPALDALIERESGRRLVVVDPNVRPAVIRDRLAYRRRFESWAERADVVKLSDGDAAWLFPDVPLEDVADRVLAYGTRLVLLTLGPDGAIAAGADMRVAETAPPVEVVDTIGAGDAFSAGFLARLAQMERLDAVGALAEAELRDALRFATAVGSLQCAHAGAEPPTLAEVESFLNYAG
jgi:fructokinase